MKVFLKMGVVEPGEYQVQVVRAKTEWSKNGNEMVSLRLCVEGGTREFFDHLVSSGSCSWKIAQFLIAMGEEPSDEMEIEPADYTGRTARAVVGVEDFEGRPKNKIVKWLPPKSAARIAAEAAAAALTQRVSGEGMDEKGGSR